MTKQLQSIITSLRNNVLAIAQDLHANISFEHDLSQIDTNNHEQLIIKLIEQIAALNGLVCNGKKLSYVNKIEHLLFRLGDLNAAILTDNTLDKEIRHHLSDFINRNIFSISRVLKDTVGKA